MQWYHQQGWRTEVAVRQRMCCGHHHSWGEVVLRDHAECAVAVPVCITCWSWHSCRQVPSSAQQRSRPGLMKKRLQSRQLSNRWRLSTEQVKAQTAKPPAGELQPAG